MDKVSAIRVKYTNGTYSDEIPISVFVENVKWDDTHTLIDILGTIDIENNGSIQSQINNKADESDIQKYITNQMATYITDWLQNNISSVGQAVAIDSSLMIAGAAAESEAVGNKIAEVYNNTINYPKDTNGEKILPISEKMLTIKADGSSDYEDIPQGNVVKDLLFDSYNEDDSKTKVNIIINTSGTPATGEVKGLFASAYIATGDGQTGIIRTTSDGYLWYNAIGKSLVVPVLSQHTYAFVFKTKKDDDGWYNYENLFFAPDFDFTFTTPYVSIPKTKGSRTVSASDYSDGQGKIKAGAKVTVPSGMKYMILQYDWHLTDSEQEDGLRKFEIYDYTEYPVDTTYDKVVEDPIVGDTYKISYSLTRAFSSNTTTTIDGSNQYRTTIIADSGKIISSCSVKVSNTFYKATNGVITINGANSNIKIIAIAESPPDDVYVGAYSIKKELIPENLLNTKLDAPENLASSQEGQMLYIDNTKKIVVGDAPIISNCKISMDWHDVYGFWTAGYFYDPTNNYAYTQIPAGDKLWTETELRLGVSCTPYDNLISVAPGERYRYRNTQIHHDRLNMYLPGVYIFDSNKQVIQTIEGGGEYKEFTIPKKGAFMAVLYYNAQDNYSLQKYDVIGWDKKDMLTAVQANYRTYLRTIPPTMQVLDKVYFCIGADDLRPWQTKKIHDYLTSYNIRYYMAAIPEQIKSSVHDDPYKTNYDYMNLCIENGGEIIAHSNEWIQASNIDDLDMLYRYFYLHKKELEFYGFSIHGIFLAGGDGAIGVDDRINSWATYLYDYSDAFGYHFPYNFLDRGNKILQYMSPSQVDSVISQAFNEHSFACFLLHELNDTAKTAIDHMMETLSAYERGVDYEFITPYELYQKLMPSPV